MSENPTRLASPGSGSATSLFPSDAGEKAKSPWYRRRGVLVGAGVAVVLAITVITDLPSPTSRATNIASATTVIQQVNNDMAPCVFSVNEAFTIYGDQMRHALTAADRARVPALLQDDQTACSFTDESIFDLSDIDVPGSASGKQLADIVNSVTLWATSDALGAVDAIQTLSTDPTNAGALAALAKDKDMLASDRAAADASLRSIDAMLDAQIVALYLPQVPAPSPTS
jgi:hypothetical protein